jgi:hypothetical protein
VCLAVAQVLLRYDDERHWLRAASRWVGHLFPRMLGQSEYNDRVKAAAPLMEAALRWLAEATPGSAEMLRLMDATPVPCGQPVIAARRGHRTLVVTPQGRQGRDDPARAAHRPGDRPGHRRAHRRPVFLAADGRRLDRHGAARIVRRVARRAGISKRVDDRPAPPWAGKAIKVGSDPVAVAITP